MEYHASKRPIASRPGIQQRWQKYKRTNHRASQTIFATISVKKTTKSSQCEDSSMWKNLSVNKLDGNKLHLKESLCVHPFTLFRQDTRTFDLFCASQEVREAILGVHKHFHHEVGWRQRHGARFLVPGYSWKKMECFLTRYPSGGITTKKNHAKHKSNELKRFSNDTEETLTRCQSSGPFKMNQNLRARNSDRELRLLLNPSDTSESQRPMAMEGSRTL